MVCVCVCDERSVSTLTHTSYELILLFAKCVEYVGVLVRQDPDGLIPVVLLQRRVTAIPLTELSPRVHLIPVKFSEA